MDKAMVNWSKDVIRSLEIATSHNEYLDNHGYYAIISGKWDSTGKTYRNIKLHYIGKAYEQTIRTRVQKEHVAYKCINKYTASNPESVILVMTGVVTQKSIDRLTHQFVDDIEACLIMANQPTCNSQSTESYSGRSIHITNTGDYSPLKEKCDCE